MHSIKDEIILKALDFLNEYGVHSFRLKDIRIVLEIEDDELKSFFKTKRELMLAILEVKQAELSVIRNLNEQLLNKENWTSPIDNYLKHILKFSFYYINTISLSPFSKKVIPQYQDELNEVQLYTVKATQLSVVNGNMIKEPRKGLYIRLSESAWAVIQDWLRNKTVSGSEENSFQKIFVTMMDLFRPYFTAKGETLYVHFLNQKDL